MGHLEFIGIYEKMNPAKPRRRILFLFGHLHKGGMQRAVSNISLALPDYFDQYVGFFGTEGESFEYCATLHNFNVPGSLNIGIFSKIGNIFSRLYKLRKFVKETNIDAVISFGETANILSVLSFNSAYRILSIRSSIGGYGDTTIYDRIYGGLIRWVYPFSDAIVAVSEDLKKQIEKITNNAIPVYHIPNLYHLEKIRALSVAPFFERSNYLTKLPFLLNVASLVNPKGQILLIRAFAKISSNFPDLQLVLIGCGPEKNKYIAESELLGVRDRVVIIEFDSNPYKYMRMATVFVLPSLTEGFPNVLVEAMACGCPVIAFDCPTGPREILGASEYGELVENISVAELAKAINNLLSSPKRLTHLKEQATVRAAHYDANLVINRWVNILTNKPIDS